MPYLISTDVDFPPSIFCAFAWEKDLLNTKYSDCHTSFGGGGCLYFFVTVVITARDLNLIFEPCVYDTVDISSPLYSGLKLSVALNGLFFSLRCWP